MRWVPGSLGLWLFLNATVQAQPGCPAAVFQNEVPVSLAPLANTSIFLARQANASYTGFQLTSAPAFRGIQSTPNFAAPLTRCLPAQPPSQTYVPQVSGPPLGVPSQPAAVAQIPSGGYLVVQQSLSSFGTLLAAQFDSNMNLVAQQQYSIFTSQIALADLNGDGIPDLIAGVSGTDYNNAQVEVLLGAGGVTFQPPISQALPNSRVASPIFTSGDVNGDGKLDLLVDWGPGQGALYLLPGNGDGTFQPGVAIQNIVYSAMALADLNGDGKLDLVAISAFGGISLPVLSVALGSGSGTFAAAVDYPLASDATGSGGELAIGDLNGDGIPDIVAGGIAIFFGDGKGGFPSRADYRSDAPGGGIVLTDLDGDGRLDIVVGVYGNPSLILPDSQLSNPAYVFFGRGNGAFWGAPASSVPTFGPGAEGQGISTATADFNGDGIPDLAYASLESQISILLGSPTGAFSQRFEYQLTPPIAGSIDTMVTGDFNGDGRPDLAVTLESPPSPYSNGVAILLGNGDGTLQAPIAVTVPDGLDTPSFVTGDFNGDGKLDLGIVASVNDGGMRDEVLIFLGNGDGTFRSGAVYPAGPFAVSATTGDFNGDGKLDIAVANQASYMQAGANVSVLLGNGDGTFTPAPSIGISGLTPSNIVSGDFNRDGKSDLAVTLAANGTMAVLLSQGNTFEAPVLYPVTAPGLQVSDLNSDGIPDLIVNFAVNGSACSAGYLTGNGDGSFSAETQFAGCMGPLISLDLNRDGRPDLAGLDSAFGVVAYLNASPPQPPFTVVSAASLEYGPVAAGSLVSALGRNLSAGTAAATTQTPPTSLAGTTVSIRDSSGATLAAGLLYVSPGQVNFLVPSGAAAGAATLTISSASGSVSAAAPIAAVAPAVFKLNSSGLAAACAILVSSDGAQTVEPVYTVQNGVVAANPISAGSATTQTYLSLYGTGIRGASNVMVTIQGVPAPVIYAGPQPDFAGLDQVNVLMPEALTGAGVATIVLSADGIAANETTIAIK